MRVSASFRRAASSPILQAAYQPTFPLCSVLVTRWLHVSMGASGRSFMSTGTNGCGSNVEQSANPMRNGRGNGHSSAGREEPLAFPSAGWDAFKICCPLRVPVQRRHSTGLHLSQRKKRRQTDGLLPARLRPEVDAAIGGVAIDFTELVRRKNQLVDRTDVLFQL